jgi:DNA polymerase-3 subunit gamma/tau
MDLIRLAHTSDLPAPDEVIRSLGGSEALSLAGGKPGPRDNGGARELPLNRAAPSPAASAGNDAIAADEDEWDAGVGEMPEDVEASASVLPDPRSFEDVVTLVGERRDAKLKVHLEEHVSLVKFDAGAGSIDLFLLPGAPPQIANELREKLIAWTQRRWMVVLSKEAGERPIGEVRREREAAELEALKSHPALKAVLDEFPDAQIAAVRPLAGPPLSEADTDETGTDG